MRFVYLIKGEICSLQYRRFMQIMRWHTRLHANRFYLAAVTAGIKWKKSELRKSTIFNWKRTVIACKVITGCYNH